MGNALKYTLVSLLAIVLLLLALVYGLYFAGARHLPADWKPATATYPDSARAALWRSLGGQGKAKAEGMSPIGYAWRIARMLSSKRLEIPPGVTLASRSGRLARLMANASAGNRHLVDVAATVKASQWPVEQQLDIVLDNERFAAGVIGYRKGAMVMFAVPVERLDTAQMHLLSVVAWSPSRYDPWCHHDALRDRALDKARQWNASVSPRQLDAALASIGPPPAGSRCASGR